MFNCVSRTPDTNEYYMDLTNPQDFDYSEIKENDVVLMLAGLSSPDDCAKNPDLAEKINFTGTKFFINGCLKQKAKVIFFSSDTVYGAVDNVCFEDTVVNPIGIYAQMKNKIEAEFKSEAGFKSFRLSYVFGQEDKFMKYLYGCSAKKNVAQVYHPLLRNVVHIKDVAEAVINVILKWQDFSFSILNVCGLELLSRVDLVRMYCEYVDATLKVEIITPGENFFAQRPKVIKMSSHYFEQVLGRKPDSIKDVFEKEIKNKEKQV